MAATWKAIVGDKALGIELDCEMRDAVTASSRVTREMQIEGSAAWVLWSTHLAVDTSFTLQHMACKPGLGKLDRGQDPTGR